MMAVYILELDSPLGNEKHEARFYVGFAADVDARLAKHASGKGSRFTQAACERKISMRVVVTFPDGDRAVERKIKNRKNTRQIVESARNGRLTGFGQYRVICE